LAELICLVIEEHRHRRVEADDEGVLALWTGPVGRDQNQILTRLELALNEQVTVNLVLVADKAVKALYGAFEAEQSDHAVLIDKWNARVILEAAPVFLCHLEVSMGSLLNRETQTDGTVWELLSRVEIVAVYLRGAGQTILGQETLHRHPEDPIIFVRPTELQLQLRGSLRALVAPGSVSFGIAPGIPNLENSIIFVHYGSV